MNKQLGFAVGLLMYGLAALAAVAVVGTAVYKAKHWCNSACESAQAETEAQKARADRAEAAIKTAQKEAERLRLAWAADSVEAQRRLIQREGELNVRFLPIQGAARSLPPAIAGVPFGAPAVRVLDNAVSAANAALTGPAAQAAPEARSAPGAPEGSSVGLITAWAVDVTKLYAACVDQVLGWQAFYASLQSETIREGLH